MMAFAILYLLFLLLPGFLISRLVKLGGQALLYCLSFSLFYFTAILATSFYFNLSAAHFKYLYLSLLVILIIANCRHIQKPKINAQFTGALTLVIACSIIYLALVGAYVELPGDYFRHLEIFKSVQNLIQTDQLKAISSTELLSKKAQYWYHLPTLISDVLDSNFFDQAETFANINAILLIASIFSFGYWLFQRDCNNHRQLFFTALLSVIFFIAHFGINAFSYIRYYAVAPTILSYCIYLTAVICLFSYFRCEIGLKKFLFLSAALCFTALVLHAQEALFILLIYILSIALMLLKKLFGRPNNQSLSISNSLPNSFTALSITALFVTFSAIVYVISFKALAPFNSAKLIALPEAFGVDEVNYVLNPLFQFYTVLTHWGGWVYLLYLVYYRRFFSGQSFLLATMLIPIVTVFNPIFTSFFLRLGYADVLWRLLYMLALYFVAARVVVGLLSAHVSSTKSKIFNYCVVILTFALLLPINVGSINLPYSRIYSLTSTNQQAHPQHWQELLDYLNSLPQKEVVITDPVTGYLITALTKHHNNRFKFYTGRMRDRFHFDSYDDHPLKKYAGQLFILNQREGSTTDVARVARHWHPDTLKLKHHYNDALIKHLETEKNHFRLLWATHDIKVYRINY